MKPTRIVLKEAGDKCITFYEAWKNSKTERQAEMNDRLWSLWSRAYIKLTSEVIKFERDYGKQT